MEEQIKDEHLSRRIAVRVITVVLSIPFAAFILFAIIMSTDSPTQDVSGTILRLALFFVPIILLLVSLISKKLYWLWLAVMVIIVIAHLAVIAYGMAQISKQSEKILSEYQNNFDCVGEKFHDQPPYLSIQDNGDIFQITIIGGMSFADKIGQIESDGSVFFSKIDEGYKDKFLNCKNKEGQLLKDVYKNITFKGS